MKRLYYLCLIFLFITGCSKIKENRIQGKWAQSNPAEHPGDSLLVEFKCDSFYLDYIGFLDTTGLDPSPCNQVFIIEYAKGLYDIEGKKITFTGIYCDSLFVPLNPITTLCYSIGEYFQEFDMQFCDQKLIMEMYNYVPGATRQTHREFRKIEDYPNCK